MSNSAFEHVASIRYKKYGLDEYGNSNTINPLASDFKGSIDLLAQGLYTKNVHFIFELIQNAEDNLYYKNIEPTLTFRLLQNDPTQNQRAKGALIVENNEVGFTKENIDAICAIAKSTKNKQDGFIGEKGIGFKSIFRVTSNPYLFSNGYQISLPKDHHATGLGYIVPEWVKNVPNYIDTSITTIVLPLDQPDFSYDIVKKMLWEIEPETILFLSKLKEIKIETDLCEGFSIIKDDSFGQKIQILSNKNKVDEILEFILFKRIFEKPQKICHEKRIDINEREVTIAFPVNESLKSAGKLFAYLPVRLDTGLPFTINADFILTSSREDIQDTSWNREWLIPCVGDLLYESLSLSVLKNNNMISVNLLHMLAKSFLLLKDNDLYYPISDAINKSFSNLNIIPADDGTYIFFNNAKLASADWLRKLLLESQLNLLYGKEVKWVHRDITERGHPELWKYFREKLKIEELTPDGFVRKLDSIFFDKQSDQWMIDFYKQLSNQSSLWKKGQSPYLDGPLRKKQFIRLQDNTHIRPFDDDGKPKVYINENDNANHLSPTVKNLIANHKDAGYFLKYELKIPKFDIIAEVVNHILPKYSTLCKHTNEENICDIEKIFIAYKSIRSYKSNFSENKKILNDALQDVHFILGVNNTTGNMVYKRPCDLYVKSKNLELFFTGNPDIYFVSSMYNDEIIEMFFDIGVSKDVRIKRKNPDNKGFVKISQYHGTHIRGLNGFDPDIEVDGLLHAISEPSLDKSCFIWNSIALQHATCISGKIEKSTKQTYENSNIIDKVSEFFGRLLIEYKWIPGLNGQFYSPTEISLEELPSHFKKDEVLADKLGMKKSEKVNAIEILSEGNPVIKSFLEYIATTPHDDKFIKRIEKFFPTTNLLQHDESTDKSFSDGLAMMFRSQRGRTSRVDECDINELSKPVSNPYRYQNILDDEINHAKMEDDNTLPTFCFSPVRNMMDNRNARDFLYIEYQGRCQITGTTFLKANSNINGESVNYFEACSLLSYRNASYLNNPGNMLSVSADTMAKLRHASFEWIDEIGSIINDFERGGSLAQTVEVEIMLAGEKKTIKWSQRHFMMLISLYKNC